MGPENNDKIDLKIYKIGLMTSGKRCMIFKKSFLREDLMFFECMKKYFIIRLVITQFPCSLNYFM